MTDDLRDFYDDVILNTDFYINIIDNVESEIDCKHLEILSNINNKNDALLNLKSINPIIRYKCQRILGVTCPLI